MKYQDLQSYQQPLKKSILSKKYSINLFGTLQKYESTYKRFFLGVIIMAYKNLFLNTIEQQKTKDILINIKNQSIIFAIFIYYAFNSISNILQYQNFKQLMSITYTRKSLQSQSDHQKRVNNIEECLLVQIKIKNKISKVIKIANINNIASIDQEIKWFIQTNNLKQAAFDYIKQIIADKINEKRQSKSRTFELTQGQSKKKDNTILINITKSKHKQNTCEKKNEESQVKTSHQKTEPHHLTIKINSRVKNIEPTFEINQQSGESFVFNSSFTLPSSINEKERSFLTDKLFENVFETTGNHSQNFQNISQIQSFQDVNIKPRITTLGVKNYQEFKFQANAFKKCQANQDNKLFTPRKPPIKITSIKQNQQNIPEVMTPITKSRKKMISTKDRKKALMTPKSGQKVKMNEEEFRIYDAQNLQDMVLDKQKQMKESHFSDEMHQSQDFHLRCIPEYLQQDLKRLYKKLTLNNPHGVEQLHSQYVSYQKLGRQELLFMGSLFEKIDHKELNHLNFNSFKKNSVKYCLKELQQMHNVRNRSQVFQKRSSNPIQFRID